MIKVIALDDYVTDVLMRDLVGHDRAPSAFLVYLHLWAESEGRKRATVRASHQTIAEAIGLSKSAVQKGVSHLLKRRLLKVHRDSVTATPEYRVQHPWRR